MMDVTNDKITGLLKREMERKFDMEKKKEDKKRVTAEHERIDFFQDTFAEKRLQIENMLLSSPHVPADRLPAHFDAISKMILNLQKYVATSNIFLRCYDIKVCHETIQNLTVKAKELEDQLLPKKKFGFKNKTKLVKVDNDKIKLNGYPRVEEEKDQVDFRSKSRFNESENICGFISKFSENLTLNNSDVLKKDVTLRNLENCVIKIYGSPSTIHMSYLRNCLILCGPVSTSIFADNCTKCKLAIACQQLRLHGSSDVDIYLHVTSRAIMEDCKRISIAPYNFQYDNIKHDFLVSGLDLCTNNWTSVDDFNWLNLEKQSPNWRILNEKEQISDWDKFLLTTALTKTT